MDSVSPSRIVDAHQHVCWHGRDGRGLIADMDRHGIAYAWLLTWLIGPQEERPEYHFCLDPARHEGNDTNPGVTLAQVLTAAKEFPRRFVTGYCPHPTWQNAVQLLESARAMHGVRVCGEWKFRMLIDDPRCLELFRAAGRLKMPVVLHLDVPYLAGADGRREFQPQWYGGTVANLERALAACPDTTFIGHAPGFWREISGDADTATSLYPEGAVAPDGRLYRLFDTYPNLHADLSASSGRIALARDPGHAVAFLVRYADRLLFARDYYEQDLHALLRTLALPQDVVDKLYWRNAERLVAPPA